MNEHKAKEERSALRRAVVDEAIGRVAEFEEKLEQHRKVTNQQGRALEALANVITAQQRELAELAQLAKQLQDVISLSPWLRFLAWRIRRRQASAVVGQTISVPKKGKIAIRFVKEFDLESPEGVNALPGVSPALDHLHQFEKDGLSYRCTVDGCGKVATLDEIAAEADYLRSKADAQAKA